MEFYIKNCEDCPFYEDMLSICRHPSEIEDNRIAVDEEHVPLFPRWCPLIWEHCTIALKQPE